MKVSKFFVAALISGTAVFAATEAYSMDEGRIRPAPTPVLPSPVPNTVTPSAINCGCTTAAALTVDGAKFSAAIAQGSQTAKAETTVSTAKSEAASYQVRAPRHNGGGSGNSGNLD
jgi:hypothetical protein